MKMKRCRRTAGMILILSLLAVFASLLGVFDKSLYVDVLEAGTITSFLASGSVAQDIVSIPLGVILAVLSLIFLKRGGYKTFIAMLGLTGYFFYGYGLYVMQGQYTSIYHAYLAIFGLSVYSLFFGLLSFEGGTLKQYVLSSGIRKAISVFLFIVLLVLTPLWLIFSAGDVAKHIPRDTYVVFAFDLTIVFPALALTAIMLLRSIPFGNILAGVAVLKVLTVCLSVAFGEVFTVIRGGFEPNYGGIVIFGALTLISLVLCILYFINLNRETVL